jgi:hypothetical protein
MGVPRSLKGFPFMATELPGSIEPSSTGIVGLVWPQPRSNIIKTGSIIKRVFREIIWFLL